MAMHFICHSKHLDSSMSTFVVVSILILSIPFHIIELEFQIIPDHFTQPVCPLDCLWITHSNISHLGRNLHVYAEQWNVDEATCRLQILGRTLTSGSRLSFVHCLSVAWHLLKASFL